MRECVTHHICDCHRERMDALDAALAQVKEYAGNLFEENKRAAALLQQKDAALTRAEHLLQRVVGERIVSDEFGQHCLYCSWFDERYDPTPVHDADCVITEAMALLATRAGADAGEGRDE